MDPTRWFDIAAILQEMDKLTFPRQASFVLEDVLLTAEGEAVPQAMSLQYNSESIATFHNSSFDQYEGASYSNCLVDLHVDALEAVEALENCADIIRLQNIAASGSASLMALYREDPRQHNTTDYMIRQAGTFPWDALDRTFVAVSGFGPIVSDTWRATPDSLSISYSHPAYWLVIAGRSNVWGADGSYWLSCLLISLIGFLAATWLLAHMAWKGQGAKLLYQRRIWEAANAIAHTLEAVPKEEKVV